MRVLVTGGAGYVGSHAAKRLHQAGIEPVVYDDLRRGHREAARWGAFVQGELSDRKTLRAALRDHRIDAVLHFAAYAYVGESMREPGSYFRNNVVGSLDLLDELVAAGVRDIVLSSTCTTYGEPTRRGPLSEELPTVPVNPYGESKLFVEKMLNWYASAHGLRYASLRYFNAAGADPDGDLVERHDPETHLVPLALRAALDPSQPLSIFGTDYPTPDGTCIRDYVHVADLADAHLAALQRLRSGTPSLTLNLGTGRGYSVREVIAAVERVTGRRVATREAPRRPGDAPELVADPTRARAELGWAPKLSDLDTIVKTAFDAMRKAGAA